ncbi:hypothetical protein CHU98_g3817 [Xylaria longipes]|nr:hypothetical protein CHU98_g3817 [Xylaria longipes]
MPAPQEPQQQAPMEMSSTSATGVVTQQPLDARSAVDFAHVKRDAASTAIKMTKSGPSSTFLDVYIAPEPAPDDPYAERRRYPYGTFLESKTSGGWYQYPEPLPPPVPPAQRLDISDYTLPLEERFLGFKNGKPRFQRPTSTPPCPVPESTGNKRRPSSPNLPKEAAPTKRRREPPKKDLPKGDLPKGKEPSPDRGHNAKRQQGGQEPPPRAAKRAQPQGYSPPRSAPRDIPPPRTGPIPRHMPEADLSPSPLSDRSLQFRMSLSGEYVSPPSLPWMVQGQGVWSPWKPLLRMRKRKREPSARMPPQDKGEPSTCMPPPDKGETSTRMPPSNNGEPSTRMPPPDKGEPSTCMPPLNKGKPFTRMPPSNKGEPSTRMPPPDKGEPSARMPPPDQGVPSTRMPTIYEDEGESSTIRMPLIYGGEEEGEPSTIHVPSLSEGASSPISSVKSEEEVVQGKGKGKAKDQRVRFATVESVSDEGITLKQPVKPTLPKVVPFFTGYGSIDAIVDEGLLDVRLSKRDGWTKQAFDPISWQSLGRPLILGVVFARWFIWRRCKSSVYTQPTSSSSAVLVVARAAGMDTAEESTDRLDHSGGLVGRRAVWEQMPPKDRKGGNQRSESVNTMRWMARFRYLQRSTNPSAGR